jgi:MoaA/NifB/PqqE/SkfB family radical SAM enzyme
MTIEQAVQTALVYREAGRHGEAESIFKQLVDSLSDDPVSIRNMAFSVARQGNRFDALTILKAAIAAPKKYRLHFLDYAQMALSAGQTKQAEHVLRQLILIGSSGPDVETLLEQVMAASMSKSSELSAARTDLMAKQLDEFRIKLRALFIANPLDPEVLFLSAEHDFLNGDLSNARLQIDRIFLLDPGFERADDLKQRILAFESKFHSDSYVAGCLGHRIEHMDFPRNVQIETVGRCNANCTFCPHEELDRKFDSMESNVYDKMIKDLSIIPATNPLNIFFNVVNEPFMDKKLFDRIELVNTLIPHAKINIYTNMNVRPRRFIERLRQIRNLQAFNVSFNAANEKDYLATMRIDFKRTVSNLKLLFTENRNSRIFPAPICLSRIASSDENDTIFIGQCKEVFSEFEYGVDYYASCRYRANWLGSTDDIQTRIPYSMPCGQWFNISVLCNGVVPHCCMDAKGEFPFGNIKEDNILDIYNNPHFRNLRTSVTSREQTFPCKTCGLM